LIKRIVSEWSDIVDTLTERDDDALYEVVDKIENALELQPMDATVSIALDGDEILLLQDAGIDIRKRD
jgi:hypothetical protein